jgi:hypothetical protein
MGAPQFSQCRCAPLRPQPQPLGFTAQDCGAGAGVAPAVAEAKVENFFASLVEPQCGHLVPAHSFDRTRISLSVSQWAQ